VASNCLLLSKLSAILAKEFEFASFLNSQARLAATERASCSIQRFYDNCKSGHPGKKGYPKFQKNNRFVVYKQTGWKLSKDRKHINFTDKNDVGSLKLIGNYDLHYYQIDQIKRVRIIRRSDGYYVQFAIEAERNVDIKPTGKTIGLDVGISAFYTDSQGHQVENTRHLLQSEKAPSAVAAPHFQKEKRF